MLGTKWLRSWNYVGLPILIVIALLMAFDPPKFRYEVMVVAVLLAGVAVGLHRRRLWAWQWNWVALAIVYLAMLVPAPIRTTYDSFVDYFTQGLLQLASFRWTHDSLGDLVLPLAVRLLVASLIWLWPNWRYWRKRERLFS